MVKSQLAIKYMNDLSGNNCIRSSDSHLFSLSIISYEFLSGVRCVRLTGGFASTGVDILKKGDT